MEKTTEKTYRVSVGRAEYTVSCRSKKEAIERARANLRHEMPHLGTVIQGIHEKEFRVDRVDHVE
ncbi:MAG: hypothetical protein JW888_06095 [Pirellulales bacterium]|nr:hypothetical protein [Pirellulales bacterium]